MANLSQFNSGLLKFNTTQVIGNPSSSTQSAAFQSDTVAIAIGSSSASSSHTSIHFNIGANPTATTANAVMPSIGHNTGATQSGGGNYIIIGVTPGEKIACLRSAGDSVNANIIELKY